MVTGAEITGAIGGLKGALDLVKGVKAVSEGLAVQDVQMELGQRILEAQAALNAALATQTEAAERIRDLEQEIVRLKDWEAEKQRYELADTGQGSLAFSLKKGMEDGEPPHWLCPNCYQQGKKSIMHPESLPVGRCDTLNCHPCGLELVTHGKRMAPSAGAFGRGGRR